MMGKEKIVHIEKWREKNRKAFAPRKCAEKMRAIVCAIKINCFFRTETKQNEIYIDKKN